MRKNCYIYEIEYTYKNGYRNAHKILSKIDDPDKIKNIIKTQLEKSNKARFRFKKLFFKTSGKILIKLKQVVNYYTLN